MGINAKTWAPLAAAVVLGGIAAKTGYDIVAQRPAAKVVVQKVSRMVTAAEDVAPGTALRPELLTVSNVPEGAAPPGGFDYVERLTNRVTTVALHKGQPVIDTMLAPEGTSRGLTAIVPEGMRAVTMEINEVSGVAGMIVPGCRVDMVSTFPGDNGQMMTRTICRALKVVAVGHSLADAAATTPANGVQPVPVEMARSVTMLVTPKEAELIDLASHTGTPRLVLRSGRDSASDSDSANDVVTVAELRDASKTKPAGWRTFVTSLFGGKQGSAVRGPTAAPTQLVSDDRKLSDPLHLFGQDPQQQPTTQPAKTRAVMVIRRTKEETVQIPLDGQRPPTREPAAQEQVGRESVFVNTDTGQAIPGGVGVDAARRGE
jgi:pilus assembly protein CpaB